MTLNFDNKTIEQIQEIIANANMVLEKRELINEGMNKIRDIINEYNINPQELIYGLGMQVTTKSIKENKKYRIAIGNNEYYTSNKKLVKKLTESSEYQELIKEQPKMIVLDVFMRAYNIDGTYEQDFPLNAKYNGERFHLNKKGVFNSITKHHYDMYLKTNNFTDGSHSRKKFITDVSV
ncbi:hypothetical protein [Scandinavium lactucae]|uniref:Uncharacterized protein n=1 Tax=Scandinavium lactucae TaxID=3095028 RepID=A0ABU4QWW6_9ENTR|nr:MULTISPECIES: hypothetical protein [unclassified Scandinavium]MDX6042819.1 hypothetical protein [Scandinavium sp. V105_6]MDX6052820.1 hypothetical protein [Scandinavium sp. V105_1]